MDYNELMQECERLKINPYDLLAKASMSRTNLFYWKRGRKISKRTVKDLLREIENMGEE
jgi:hypothetical protein